MPHRSDTRFLVLNGLRLKGFGEPPGIAAAVGLAEDAVAGELPALQEAGLVIHRDGRLSGFALTPAGRDEQEALAAADLEASGAAEDVRTTYKAFLELNDAFKHLCTDWQLRDGELYDRSDPSYNAAILDRLRAIDAELATLLGALAARLDRFGAYVPRFAAALDRYAAGDFDRLTKPIIDSYHTVWFELHEDLLAGLGIDRSQEGSY